MGNFKKYLGDCYKKSYRHCVSNGGTLVHGTVSNVSGKRFPHAWIEDDEVVHDLTKNVKMNKKTFYDYAKVDKKSVRKYDPSSARIKAVKSGHFGPWE